MYPDEKPHSPKIGGRMARNLNRRAFLGNARTAALLSAAPSLAASDDADNEVSIKYDFETPYNRIGTDSVKWDRQIRVYGKDNIVAGMGIADMDFRCAPPITKA